EPIGEERAREEGEVHEAIERVDAADMEEAEAADLIAHGHAGRLAEERARREAEAADLLVLVAHVGDLEDLRLDLEARLPVGAEEAGPLCARVPLEIDRVAVRARVA